MPDSNQEKDEPVEKHFSHGSSKEMKNKNDKMVVNQESYDQLKRDYEALKLKHKNFASLLKKPPVKVKEELQ